MFFCTCIIFQDQCHKAGKGSMCPPPLIQKKKKKGKKKVLFLTHGSFWPFYYVFLVRTVTGMFRKNFEKT